MFSIYRKVGLVSGVLFLLAPLTWADEVTKRTVVSVNEPVIVAGVPQVTLEPGTYVIRLMNHDHNRNIVQIFNERENQLFTTVLAINNYRLTPTGKTVLRFWETLNGNPPALRAWFAPGDNYGQEFVYPKGLAAKIARDAGQPVLVASAATEPELRTAPVTEVEATGEERPLEEAYVAPAEAETAAEVAEVAETAPEPEPVPAPLPPTASRALGIGVVGILGVLVGLALRRSASHHV